MKKFFNIFFVTLGVIFFFIILAGIYFFIADPFNIKPFIFNNDQTKEIFTPSPAAENAEMTTDENPNLSPTQEKALETIGIEAEAIPSSFTTEQIACFENILGKERVVEIKAGDTPTATEFYKAKECM